MDINTIFITIWRKKILFLSTFFAVFTLSYLVLYVADLLPEPPFEEAEGVIEEGERVEDENKVSITDDSSFDEVLVVEESSIKTDFNQSLTPSEAQKAVVPLAITIERLNKTISVSNPISRTVSDLDTALLDGAVRHPDSATLGQNGNVFILGHSSYLPTVFNKSFQAFNGIQDLEWGDIIEITSAEAVYRYKVEEVYRATAHELTIPIAGVDKKLTLATCNSFGSVDDRYIVEAVQIEVKPV